MYREAWPVVVRTHCEKVERHAIEGPSDAARPPALAAFCCCCCCSNVRFFRFLARQLVTHTKLYKQLLKTAMMVMIMVKLMKWMKGKNG